jgi:DNA-binding HxlR family transcriptional regulator
MYTVWMRSYGQYCAVAKTLDVIGDRWTLLIVRELLLRGPSRYTDLRAGLPRIATNLLAERLRELESEHVVAREEAPAPVAATLYRLTARGEELAPVLDLLGRWGMPYMEHGPGPEDVFCARWLAWPAELMLNDSEPSSPPVSIELRTGEEPMLVEANEGQIHVRAARANDIPDTVLEGTPHVVLGVLSGKLDLARARQRGLVLAGSVAALERLLPAAPAAAPSSL